MRAQRLEARATLPHTSHFARPFLPLRCFFRRDAGQLYAVPQLAGTRALVEETLTRLQAQKEARVFITSFTREGIHVYRSVGHGTKTSFARARARRGDAAARGPGWGPSAPLAVLPQGFGVGAWAFCGAGVPWRQAR